ncbi:MAG: thioesterase, partial [Lachnospiraceae bacterium]|nr:thioesterase [Lachnospiraceae bacterium]
MYSFDSRVRYSEVGEDKKLTLNGVINYFQDCSTFQSEELGNGVAKMEEMHRIWVLSSWQIVVERYPSLCEEITVSTWPYAFQSFCGYRNF